MDELLRLDKLSTDELLTKARQVAELAAHPGWQVIEAVANLQREGQTRYLSSSPPRTRSEYAMAGGVVRGIDFVLNAPERVQKIARDRERAEAQRLQQQS